MNDSPSRNRNVKSLGLPLLVAFFSFGALMCALTVFLLLFPGSVLQPVWRLNPEAHSTFQSLGIWSILLMTIVGGACAAAAVGLAKQTRWGWRLAIAILVINLAGDTVNAIARHDPRTLIGIPIGALLIFYLITKRRLFEPERV
jgi:hypothetical protein